MKIFLIMFTLFTFSTQAAELKLLGEGRLTWFAFKVYDAKLFGEKKETSFDQTLHLEIKYLRSLDGEDIFDRTLSEWDGIGLSKERIKELTPLVKNKFPDVKDGDIIRAEYDPSKGLRVVYNGEKELITSSDLAFAKDFMGIWLSPKTSEKKLRLKLFGVD